MPAKRAKGAAGKAAKKSAKKVAKKTVKKGSSKQRKPASKRPAKGASRGKARGTAAVAAAVATGSPEQREHRITRAQAAELHTRHVGARRARGAPAPGSVGGLFSRDAVLELLQQEGAQYLRFYFAKHEDGTPGLVLAASDESLGIVGGDSALLLNNNWQCPPWCPPGSGGLT